MTILKKIEIKVDTDSNEFYGHEILKISSIVSNALSSVMKSDSNQPRIYTQAVDHSMKILTTELTAKAAWMELNNVLNQIYLFFTRFGLL